MTEQKTHWLYELVLETVAGIDGLKITGQTDIDFDMWRWQGYTPNSAIPTYCKRSEILIERERKDRFPRRPKVSLKQIAQTLNELPEVDYARVLDGKHIVCRRIITDRLPIDDINGKLWGCGKGYLTALEHIEIREKPYLKRTFYERAGYKFKE